MPATLSNESARHRCHGRIEVSRYSCRRKSVMFRLANIDIAAHDSKMPPPP